MGASQDGYMSDMTRMLFLGKPGQKIRAMYSAVLEAQLAAVDAVREGVQRGAGGPQARGSAEDRGSGQGVRALHRAWAWAWKFTKRRASGKKDKTRLKAGMVITIEPGAYVEGVGGIRIEDTVLVTKTGCEVLTPTSKELMVF